MRQGVEDRTSSPLLQQVSIPSMVQARVQSLEITMREPIDNYKITCIDMQIYWKMGVVIIIIVYKRAQ